MGFFSGFSDNIKKGTNFVVVPEFFKFPKGTLRKILHYLFIGRFRLNAKLTEWMLGVKGYLWLTTLKDNDIVVFANITNIRILRCIRHFIPMSVKVYVFYNNCLRFMLKPSKITKVIESAKNMGFNIVTFDPQDAIDYNISYTVQFYGFPKLKNVGKKYDFFFCGLRKERGDELDKLKKALEDMGYKCLFIMPNHPKQGVSYEKYLDYLQESRCLIDLTNDRQLGLTRRPLESLFYNTKLMTNNEYVEKCSFYRRSNVFLLGKDYFEELDSFMKQDIEIVPDEIKKEYDINTWIEKFK